MAEDLTAELGGLVGEEHIPPGTGGAPPAVFRITATE